MQQSGRFTMIPARVASTSRVGEVQAPLDAVEPGFHAINPPVHFAETHSEVTEFHHDGRHADFQIENISVDPVKPLMHPRGLLAEIVRNVRRVARCISISVSTIAPGTATCRTNYPLSPRQRLEQSAFDDSRGARNR